MPNSSWSAPTCRHLPIILIRGFGGLDVEDERALAYQGFNDGSVYPHKRGENYIYEGLILRLLKHRRRYYDATNVVGYFANPVTDAQPIPGDLAELDTSFFAGHKVVIDPGMARRLLQSEGDPFCTVWVFRYYDLNDRTFAVYGEALVRLIQFIQALLKLRRRADPEHKSPPKVNIIAHSMGGLIVREAIQRAYPKLTGGAGAADQAINKIVTLGTPHKGISFQLIRDLRWLGLEAEQELEHFNPERQKSNNEAAWVNFHKHFPLDRLLTVVGTNYRSYGVRSSKWANRLFAVGGEYGPNYNRSDGLVKQAYAQIDGAPRTFVHKCHGGFDSLVTSRETYEIAIRFFNGNVRARLYRTFAVYGEALVRLIQFIQALLRIRGRDEPEHRDAPIKVNIVAHSMGGLIVREAIQRAYPRLTGRGDAADQAINKVVTLGTPHKGISFQLIRELRWLGLEAEEELEHFNPRRQVKLDNAAAWVNFHKHFPLERLLTVVGTNYQSYGVRSSKWANRLFAVGGEYGPNYNRSDGLVKQAYAQIDGAPRTFVHKCHGGFDSLVTSRETYEIATRFFNGNVRARLRLIDGKIKRGFDWIGKSEFFFGVSIKPRRVDFELFHQSKDAENCYGPFHTDDLSDGDPAFAWADSRRLIWEGCLDVDFEQQRDLVLRADFYVGERDLFGIGFSDNVVFYKQYYVRAIFKNGLELFLYTGEEFAGEQTDESTKSPLPYRDGGWQFEVTGTGFEATLQIELDWVPEDGDPVPLEPRGTPAKTVPV